MKTIRLPVYALALGLMIGVCGPGFASEIDPANSTNNSFRHLTAKDSPCQIILNNAAACVRTHQGDEMIYDCKISLTLNPPDFYLMVTSAPGTCNIVGLGTRTLFFTEGGVKTQMNCPAPGFWQYSIEKLGTMTCFSAGR